MDCLDHGVEFLVQLLHRKSQYIEAAMDHVRIPLCVTALIVQWTIDLDHQHQRYAAIVGEMFSDRMLLAKRRTHAAVAKMGPKTLFSLGCLATKFTSEHRLVARAVVAGL